MVLTELTGSTMKNYINEERLLKYKYRVKTLGKPFHRQTYIWNVKNNDSKTLKISHRSSSDRSECSSTGNYIWNKDTKILRSLTWDVESKLFERFFFFSLTGKTSIPGNQI